MIKLFWRHIKGLLIWTLFISFFTGLILPLQTVLIQRIIDTASASYVQQAVTKELIVYTICLLLLLLASIGTEKIQALMNIKLQNQLEISWGRELFNTIAKIKYEYFESQDTYVVIDRLITNFRTNATSTIRIIPSIISLVVSLVGIIAYIVQAGWQTVLLLAVTSVPIWSISVIASLKERNVYRQVFSFFKRSKYLSSLINSREHIKEARIYNYNTFVSEKWKETLIKYQDGVFYSNLKERNVAGFLVMLQYIAITGVLFSLLKPLNNGIITVGFLVALAQVLWSFVGSLQFRIISIIQDIHTFKFFKDDYNNVISYDFQEQHPILAGQSNTIKFEYAEFKDVWFRYSESDKYILQGINLSITKGETIALVGTNGCGKTTIIKLLLGLLLPTKGLVLINGIDTRQIDGESRKKLMAAIFQDYARYSLTLKESITLAPNVDDSNNNEILSLLTSLSQEDRIMNNMSSGLNTILGKNLDNGIDLSGGQWQTVAIARALYANTPLLIMDEPTASLDPIAESEVYAQLAKATVDKTVIFVTHRLGSAKFADTIMTLENGCITERGGHDQLLKLEGTYAKMYTTQKQWYE